MKVYVYPCHTAVVYSIQDKTYPENKCDVLTADENIETYINLYSTY